MAQGPYNSQFGAFMPLLLHGSLRGVESCVVSCLWCCYSMAETRATVRTEWLTTAYQHLWEAQKHVLPSCLHDKELFPMNKIHLPVTVLHWPLSNSQPGLFLLVLFVSEIQPWHFKLINYTKKYLIQNNIVQNLVESPKHLPIQVCNIELCCDMVHVMVKLQQQKLQANPQFLNFSNQ